jgi:hypothetical protein
MNLWYNQALKMDRTADLRFNFRDIRYQSLLAFRTASGMVNIPLIKNENQDQQTGKSFLSATAGGAFDKSNKGFYKNSTGLLGLSYSQKLSDEMVYISAGFQGSLTQTSLGTSGALFPDQFDQYGPLPSATRDPLRAGRSYNWMGLNAGLSLYKNAAFSEWYIGASLRHLNRPFTDEQKTNAYRLAPTVGMQAGIIVKNDDNQVGVYGIANLKAKAHEYLLGGNFTSMVNYEKDGSSIGFGLALRLNDAVIPNLQLKLNTTTIGFHYDINISGLKAAGYSRQGFELAVLQRFN